MEFVHLHVHSLYSFLDGASSLDTLLDKAAALRERGTDSNYWHTPFDGPAEKEILDVIERMQSLISGSMPFSSTENPNKCHACRLQNNCQRARNKADLSGGTS